MTTAAITHRIDLSADQTTPSRPRAPRSYSPGQGLPAERLPLEPADVRVSPEGRLDVRYYIEKEVQVRLGGRLGGWLGGRVGGRLLWRVVGRSCRSRLHEARASVSCGRSIALHGPGLRTS
jgi:hypothetical protein